MFGYHFNMSFVIRFKCVSYQLATICHLMKVWQKPVSIFSPSELRHFYSYKTNSGSILMKVIWRVGWEAVWHWWVHLFRVEPSNYSPLWTSQAADQIKRLYDLFLKVDATQVEVNPFGETPEGQGTLCVLTWPLCLFM